MRQNLSLAAVIVAYIAASGCTVNRTDLPTPTGPSGFGTSVLVTATPDLVKLGSLATTLGDPSVVTVQVRDGSGQPQTGVAVRVDMLVNGVALEPPCGQLSSRNIVTGSSGLASTVFTAPGTPLPQPECSGFTAGNSVAIRATPVGTNVQTAISQAANIRMVPFTPTGGSGPIAVNFSISPNPGKVKPAVVTFSDAGSVSPGHSITSYTWTWSDGSIPRIGQSVVHDFDAAGTYTVRLTVADDIGQVSFKDGLFTITP